jgi:phosphoglycerol transferase MdoB-like AlkP superfamily enzyme
MDTIEEAWNCGQTNGFLYAALITPVVLYFTYKAYHNFDNKKLIAFTTLFALALVWTIIPILLRFGYGNMYLGYTSTINNLISQGLTRFQAISIMASLYGNTNLSSVVSMPGASAAGVFASSNQQQNTNQNTNTANK